MRRGSFTLFLTRVLRECDGTFIFYLCCAFFSYPGRKDVTLGKHDIKVETVNKEDPLSSKELEEDDSSISTATRVMKAVYTVRTCMCLCVNRQAFPAVVHRAVAPMCSVPPV